MNMANTRHCIPFGYKIQPSNLSNLVEYVQNDHDFSEMDKLLH